MAVNRSAGLRYNTAVTATPLNFRNKLRRTVVVIMLMLNYAIKFSKALVNECGSHGFVSYNIEIEHLYKRDSSK
jgi:hypothetical protein